MLCPSYARWTEDVVYFSVLRSCPSWIVQKKRCQPAISSCSVCVVYRECSGLLHNGPAAPQVDLILLIDGFPEAVDGHQNSYLVQLLRIAGCNWVKWFFSFCVCSFAHLVYVFPSVQVIHMLNDVLMVWISHSLFLGPLRFYCIFCVMTLFSG